MKGGLYTSQRVGVFVDVQNMYYSARNLYKSKVDFAKLLKTAVQNRKLIRAIAYVIKAHTPEEQNFFDALTSMGYEVKIKELREYYGGEKKGDWDMGIAIDAIELVDKLDVSVLVSGDGDFTYLIEHLLAKGLRTEVMAFGKTTSKKLEERATNFIDMDKKKNKLLI